MADDMTTPYDDEQPVDIAIIERPTPDDLSRIADGVRPLESQTRREGRR